MREHEQINSNFGKFLNSHKYELVGNDFDGKTVAFFSFLYLPNALCGTNAITAPTKVIDSH
jgi:hypothetical protein